MSVFRKDLDRIVTKAADQSDEAKIGQLEKARKSFLETQAGITCALDAVARTMEKQ